MRSRLKAFRATAIAPALFLAAAASSSPNPAHSATKDTASTRSTLIVGCWGDANKGDGAELKLAFREDGSMVQYDENQQDRRRRTFGAWEMQKDSTFLVLYWPDGTMTRYNVKRIGPILHFQGLYGVRNFTLRQLASRECWTPRE